jgi:hypothetical protein
VEREFHPVANIFPLIEGARFDDLVSDIKAHGLREPITLHPDGRILDGRNRYLACLAAGIKPRFREWDGDGLAVDFGWSLNGPRRHMTKEEQVIAAGKYAIEHESESKARELSNLKVGANAPVVSVDTTGDYGRSREKAAEKFSVSEATVGRAVTVLKEGTSELVKAVERGDVAVSAAAVIAKATPERQAEVVAMPEPERQKAVDRIRSDRKRTPDSDFQLRKAMAMPDAGAGSVRKWPKKADVDQVRNAVLHLQGIADALGKIDMDVVVEHEECDQWRKSMKGIMSVLNKFYTDLRNVKTEGSEHASRRVS